MAYDSPEKARAWRQKNAERLRAEKKLHWEKHGERYAKVKAAKYSQTVASGVCPRCMKRPAADGRLNCSPCNVSSRERHFKRQYGITIQERNDMLLRQGGRCAICQTDTASKRGWHVDHDHSTGRVRGILCGLCNVGIGNFKEDLTIMSRAMAYLSMHKGASRAA